MSHDDLDARLRGGWDALPGPGRDATERAMERIVARPPRARRLRGWAGRAVGVAAFAALAALIAFLVIAVPDASESSRPGTANGQGGVPNLVGMSLDEARRALGPPGLTLGRVASRPVEGEDPGTVVGQTPGAGAPLVPRGEVDVEIASPGGSRPAAPDVSFTVLDAGAGGSPVKKPTVALKDLRGDVVVIGFMASWCAPCRRSEEPFVPETSRDLPRVLQYLSLYEGRGARGLAVAVNDLPDDAITLKQRGPAFDSFPLALDPDRKSADALGVTGVPEVVVIDREGRIAWRAAGPTTAVEVMAVLDSLLAEPIPSDVLANAPVTELPLSVLSGPGLAPEEIPAAIRRGDGCAVYPNQVHLAARHGTMRVYFARGPADQFVVLSKDEAGPGGSGGCSPAPDIARKLEDSKAISLFGQFEPGDSWSVILVRDGYESATVDGETLPVVNNVVVLEGSGVGEIHFSGPEGSFVFHSNGGGCSRDCADDLRPRPPSPGGP